MSRDQPSLNMEHGFMQSIIRNQIDRDKYDKESRERKEQERSQQASSRSKRPEQARYIPPSKSQADRASAVVFKLEYEDEWGKIHDLVVRRNDDPLELADWFGREHEMTEEMISTLAQRLKHEVDIRS